MKAWVCVRAVDTPVGSISAGRIVADGDPMLDGVDMTAFVRVVDPDSAPVEEATAVPGQKRARARG